MAGIKGEELMSVKRPKGRPEQLGSLISSTLKGTILGERLKDIEIWHSWEKIVGPSIAGRAKPLRISGGVLSVLVSSAPWMQQLSFMKADLKKKINKSLGEDRVSDIVFKSGAIAALNGEANEEPVLMKELTVDRLCMIENSAGKFEDPEIKEQFRRLMEIHYMRNPD